MDPSLNATVARGWKAGLRPATRPAAALLALAAALALPVAANAQQPARPELSGEVVRGTDPVESAMVVLHRVTADQGGPLDSVRTGATGRFTFRLPSVPDPGGRSEVYFASVRHDGVVYFGPAVTTAVQLDSVYRIEVHDTVAAPSGGANLPLSVRYVLLEPGSSGWQVTDLFQVRNDLDRTLVAAPGDATWSHPLPDDARDFQVSGEFTDGGAKVEDGDFVVSASIPPGEQQFIVRYQIDELEGAAFPLPRGAEEMHLLIKEPAPPLGASGLMPAESVEMEPGVPYRRFVGQNLPTTVVRLGAQLLPQHLPVEWIAVGLMLVLACLGLWAMLAPPPPAAQAAGAGAGGAARALAAGGPAPPQDPAGVRERLLLEIARLDDQLERGAIDPADHARKRGLLVDRLQRLGLAPATVPASRTQHEGATAAAPTGDAPVSAPRDGNASDEGSA